MNIKFKHLKLNNFCGLHDLDTDLYDRTIVKGRNKSGKTTIKNSIDWNLFNKLSDGSAPDGIRPHDEDGKDIDRHSRNGNYGYRRQGSQSYQDPKTKLG